jgi:hypothetical protein
MIPHQTGWRFAVVTVPRPWGGWSHGATPSLARGLPATLEETVKVLAPETDATPVAELGRWDDALARPVPERLHVHTQVSRRVRRREPSLVIRAPSPGHSAKRDARLAPIRGCSGRRPSKDTYRFYVFLRMSLDQTPSRMTRAWTEGPCLRAQGPARCTDTYTAGESA